MPSDKEDNDNNAEMLQESYYSLVLIINGYIVDDINRLEEKYAIEWMSTEVLESLLMNLNDNQVEMQEESKSAIKHLKYDIA